jgi:hypothetical protein
MATNDITLPFRYKIIAKAPFDLLGFTKIVISGGEQYDEVRKDGRWDVLRQIAGADKTIYGIASFDKECTKNHYRYTLAVVKPDDAGKLAGYESQLFPFHVNESTWCVFTLEHFEKQYGIFWGQDPYKMIQKLGFAFNNRLGIHLDVYPEAYKTNDDEMEFWMPVKEPKAG